MCFYGKVLTGQWLGLEDCWFEHRSAGYQIIVGEIVNRMPGCTFQAK